MGDRELDPLRQPSERLVPSIAKTPPGPCGKLAHLPLSNVKQQIEKRIDDILTRMDDATPSELKAYAGAVAALASALSEVSGGAGNTGLRGLLQKLQNPDTHE